MSTAATIRTTPRATCGCRNAANSNLFPDTESQAIVVQGADAGQLKTIEELIKLYDQPPPTDSESVRKTETIRLRYSKAKAVAETVKDVYRDLLSDNDKALQGQNQGQGVRRSLTVFTDSYSDSDQGERKVPKFKGMLSIGIDETSNSLAVSAPAFLFDHVTKMIRDLDEAAAANSTVRMVKVARGRQHRSCPRRVGKRAAPWICAAASSKETPAKPAAKPAPKSTAKSSGNDAKPAGQ